MAELIPAPRTRTRRLARAAGLIALIAVLAVLASRGRLSRVSDLRVPANGISSTYIQMQTGSTTRCLVTDRAGTTAKRSETGLASGSWDLRRLESTRPESLATISSKRPAYLFVPVTAVSDLLFPFIYERARSQHQLDLPPLEWTHLYFNRLFLGLYLRVTLPNRRFAERSELIRTELLAVAEDTALCADRKLRGVCPLLSALIADGIHPQPEPRGEGLLLASLLPPGSGTFILPEATPGELRHFPVPVDMPRVLGSVAAHYRDERFRAWTRSAQPESAVDGFLETLLVGASEDLQSHAADLEMSITASCRAMGCDAAAHIQRLRQQGSAARAERVLANLGEPHVRAS